MCLRIKVEFPDHVLAEGNHAGYEWIVTHNGMGYRCGYVRVPKGHPWHGKSYGKLYDERIPPDVHGGLTFSEPDVECRHGGEDNAHWFGFDCAHHTCDKQDPALCSEDTPLVRYGTHIWTQPEVEAECRKLCEQAAAASK